MALQKAILVMRIALRLMFDGGGRDEVVVFFKAEWEAA